MARTCPMEKKPVHLAVLFADITGSTRLYEKLGNARALECVGLCLNIMRESALGCGGRVVQTIGDEVLCVFPTASAATHAAAEMQSRVKMAKPSQIIAGGECVEALSKPMKDQTRALDKLPVKGREQEVDVYEVLWRQGEELTYMASRAPGLPKQPQVRLCLRHGGKEMILGPGRELIRLGRENSCDIVIADRKASREHARIERRRDKFVLVDVSSNGTFVTFHGQSEMAVKREEVVLQGRGSISFGHPYSVDPTEVAAFEIETPT